MIPLYINETDILLQLVRMKSVNSFQYTDVNNQVILYSRNQIASPLTALKCIVGNISQVPESPRTIIAQCLWGAISGDFIHNVSRISQHGGYLSLSIAEGFISD